jgi:hypothetical protein
MVAREAKPSEARKALDSAMVSAGLLVSHQGPRGLPAPRSGESVGELHHWFA